MSNCRVGRVSENLYLLEVYIEEHPEGKGAEPGILSPGVTRSRGEYCPKLSLGPALFLGISWLGSGFWVFANSVLLPWDPVSIFLNPHQLLSSTSSGQSSTDKNPPFLSVVPLLCVGVCGAWGCAPEGGNYSDYSSVPLLILWTFAMVSLVHPFSRFQRHRSGCPFLLWKLIQPLVLFSELFSRFLFCFILATQMEGTTMVPEV